MQGLCSAAQFQPKSEKCHTEMNDASVGHEFGRRADLECQSERRSMEPDTSCQTRFVKICILLTLTAGEPRRRLLPVTHWRYQKLCIQQVLHPASPPWWFVMWGICSCALSLCQGAMSRAHRPHQGSSSSPRQHHPYRYVRPSHRATRDTMHMGHEAHACGHAHGRSAPCMMGEGSGEVPFKWDITPVHMGGHQHGPRVHMV